MNTIDEELKEERAFIEKLARLMDLSFQLGKESVTREKYKDYLSATAPRQAEKDTLFHDLVTEFVNRKPSVDEDYLKAIKAMLQNAFPSASERDLLRYSVNIYTKGFKVD